MVLINTAVYHDFGEDHALYAEHVEMPDFGFAVMLCYELFAQDDGTTRLDFYVNWMGAALPEENKLGIIDAQATNLRNLKHLCENDPA